MNMGRVPREFRLRSRKGAYGKIDRLNAGKYTPHGGHDGQ